MRIDQGIADRAAARVATATLAVWSGSRRAGARGQQTPHSGVFGNIYTAQKQNGCLVDPRWDGRLIDAAHRTPLTC